MRQGQTSSTTSAYLSWKLGSYRCWGRAGSRRPDGRPSAGPCRGWCGRRRNGRRSRCSRAPRPRQTGRLQHACVTSNQHQSRYLCMHIATTYSDDETRKVWWREEGGLCGDSWIVSNFVSSRAIWDFFITNILWAVFHLYLQTRKESG